MATGPAQGQDHQIIIIITIIIIIIIATDKIAFRPKADHQRMLCPCDFDLGTRPWPRFSEDVRAYQNEVCRSIKAIKS